MATATVKVNFSCDVKKVWDIVTSLDDYAWRSDLSKIEVFDEGQRFIEYTKDGYSTNFKVTNCDPYKCCEFDVENDNMKGHWIVYFDWITAVSNDERGNSIIGR